MKATKGIYNNNENDLGMMVAKTFEAINIYFGISMASKSLGKYL
jgi:hypothetical protein